MNEALELAIQTERDGIAFYSNAADKTADELGKKMFLSLVSDEKRHLAVLQKISCEEDVCIADLGDVMPKKRLKTIFSDSNATAGADDTKESDVAALAIAMEMEKKGYEQYARAAKEAEDPEIKRIYERLAAEEEEHWEILNETLSYLEDTGNWYMWDEYSFPQG
jgi:rubrerythrin